MQCLAQTRDFKYIVFGGVTESTAAASNCKRLKNAFLAESRKQMNLYIDIEILYINSFYRNEPKYVIGQIGRSTCKQLEYFAIVQSDQEFEKRCLVINKGKRITCKGFYNHQRYNNINRDDHKVY